MKFYCPLEISRWDDDEYNERPCERIFVNSPTVIKNDVVERLEKQPLNFLQYTINTVICQVSSAICGRSLSVMSDTIPLLTSKP